MANYALLIGTRAGKRELIEDGQPVGIRRKFKTMTAEDGFEVVEVVDKHQGRIRHKRFSKVAKPTPKKSVKKATKRFSKVAKPTPKKSVKKATKSK